MSVTKRLMTFSIREVLLVTALVALALGWLIDHRRFAADLAKERQFRLSLDEIKETIYRQPRYKRVWGEPEQRPIGEY